MPQYALYFTLWRYVNFFDIKVILYLKDDSHDIFSTPEFRYTAKKILTIFPARESLVSDIPAGDGKNC